MGLTSMKFATDIYGLWINKGSRLLNERAFAQQQFGNVDTRAEYLMAVGKSGGSDILTVAGLEEWLNASLVATQQVYAELNGVKYYWNDVCDRYPSGSPELNLPCTKYTILDCFSQGGFDFFLPHFPGVPPNPFPSRPSFLNRTNAELGALIKDSCKDWSGTPVPAGFMWGGSSLDASGDYTSVMSFQFYLQAAGAQQMATRIYKTSKPTQAQINTANSLMLNWESNFVSTFQAIQNNFQHIQLAFFVERSPDDILTNASGGNITLLAVGYTIMLIFCAFAFWRPNHRDSKAIVGFFGVLLSCCGVFASLGLSAFFGIVFNPLHLQVLPFLAVGLGSNDMFVVGFSYHVDKRKTIPEQLGACYKECASSVTLASFINMFAFLIGGTMPLPAVAAFSYSATLVILVNYIITMVAFGSILAIDAEFKMRAIANNKPFTIYPCLLSPGEADEGIPIPTSPTAPNSPATPSPCEAAAIPDSSVSYLESVRAADPAAPFPWYTWRGFSLEKVSVAFALLSTRRLFKAIVLVTFTVIFCVASWGSTQLQVGLALEDIVVSGSYEANFLTVRDEYYSDFESYVMCGMAPDGTNLQVDYPNMGPTFISMQNALNAVPDVNKEIPISMVSWYSVFTLWVKTTHPANMTGSLVTPSAFYTLLHEYITTTTRGLSFTDQLVFGSNGELVASKFLFYQTGIVTTQDYIDAILTSRGATDPTQPVLGCFPGGFIYNFYEQYISTLSDMELNMLYVGVMITVTSLAFLYHPGATLILLTVVFVIAIDTIGFMNWMTIKLNGVSVINLVTSMGINIQFVAYITKTFMTARGTRDERVQESLIVMFFPVFCGGISTALSVCAMGFAQYNYFIVYFFYMYFLFVFAGLFNGLLLLPTLLSLIGPASLGKPSEDNSPIIRIDGSLASKVDQKPEDSSSSAKSPRDSLLLHVGSIKGAAGAPSPTVEMNRHLPAGQADPIVLTTIYSA